MLSNSCCTFIQFEEDRFILRTRDEHEAQCAHVEDPDASTEYGINRRSILLDLKYLDICSGSLLPDVMHDILEGALQYELKLVLQYCIRTRRFFRLSALNEKIEGMELGYMESDRPAPITAKTLRSTSNVLKQKGIVHVCMSLLGLYFICTATASTLTVLQ